MAEHSAVNRRVVGSSPTWGVKKKKDHPKDGPFLFFAAQIKLKQIPLQKLSKAVNCKDAETLAVRGGVRRLWRRGRSSIAEAIIRGYRKSYCVDHILFRLLWRMKRLREHGAVRYQRVTV